MGIKDVEPPQQFGVAEPADQLYNPGDEISVTFHETIQCQKPYRFSVELRLNQVQQVYDESHLVMVCEGRKISIAFRASIPFRVLNGEYATIAVTGVQDAAANVASSVSFVFRIAPTDLERASVLVKVTFPAHGLSQ